ncbi:hypothetical protein Cpir12675_004283 [Ceratocystis pirilliformis]|uniref:F-box domain-containing protein n=1 Tax=Ceratocystis pirilliformis TaxID=259994 RepID=A0ABR3YYU4_9PEZI
MSLTPVKVRGSYRRRKRPFGSINPHNETHDDPTHNTAKSVELISRAIETHAGSYIPQRHGLDLSRKSDLKVPTTSSVNRPTQPRLVAAKSRLLETLPVEILEIIFMYADSVYFPRASPLLGRALSSRSLLIAFTMYRFEYTWDFYHGLSTYRDVDFAQQDLERLDSMDANGDLEMEVITQPWLNYDIFVGALEMWHKKRNMKHWFACPKSRAEGYFDTQDPIEEESTGVHAVGTGPYTMETLDNWPIQAPSVSVPASSSSSVSSPPPATHPQVPPTCICTSPMNIEACIEKYWAMYRESATFRDILSAKFSVHERYPLCYMNSTPPFIKYSPKPETELQAFNNHTGFQVFSDIPTSNSELPQIKGIAGFRCPTSYNKVVLPKRVVWGKWFEKSAFEYSQGTDLTESNGIETYAEIAKRIKLVFLLTHHEHDDPYRTQLPESKDWETDAQAFQWMFEYLEQYVQQSLVAHIRNLGIPPIEVVALVLISARVKFWPANVCMRYYQLCNILSTQAKQKAADLQMAQDYQSQCWTARYEEIAHLVSFIRYHLGQRITE